MLFKYFKDLATKKKIKSLTADYNALEKRIEDNARIADRGWAGGDRIDANVCRLRNMKAEIDALNEGLETS